MNRRFTYVRTRGTSDDQARFETYMMYMSVPEARPIFLAPAEKEVNEFLSYCRDLEMIGWTFEYEGVVSATAPETLDSFEAGKTLSQSFGGLWGGRWIRS